MKNRIFAIILVVLLSLPITVQAVDEEVQVQPVSVEETLPQTSLDEDVVENEQVAALPKSVSPYKQPISKRKIAKKFILAMFSVVVSSFVIFLALTFYNKLRGVVLNKTKISDGETQLDTPLDTQSAIKTFLEKTKWG